MLTPTGLVLYAEFPDWMLMYLANPAHLSPIFMFPLVLALYLGSPLLGFLIAHRLLRQERERLVRGLLVGLGAAMALVAVLGRARLLGVAYYDAFHGGGEVLSVFRSSLLLALFPCSVAIVGILAFAVISVRRHAEVAERLPPTKREGLRVGLDGNTAQLPKTAALPKAADPRTAQLGEGTRGANLPRPPQGATPGS